MSSWLRNTLQDSGVLELVPNLAARNTQSQGKRWFGLGRKTQDESHCGSSPL
jgi:hypothetical protein